MVLASVMSRKERKRKEGGNEVTHFYSIFLSLAFFVATASLSFYRLGKKVALKRVSLCFDRFKSSFDFRFLPCSSNSGTLKFETFGKKRSRLLIYQLPMLRKNDSTGQQHKKTLQSFSRLFFGSTFGTKFLTLR